METLDLRSLACPEPVIRTKQAIEAHPNSVLAVLVTSATTVTNVTRMARAMGADVRQEEAAGGEFRLTLTTSSGQAAPSVAPQPEPCGVPAPGGRSTVFLNNNVMGIGDDQLGRILMKAFLKTLKSAEPLPAEIICVNNGVHLTAEGSEELPVLQELAAKGVEIVSCGTCLDFFKKLDKVKVGVVGNMFDIVGRLNKAVRIIAP